MVYRNGLDVKTPPSAASVDPEKAAVWGERLQLLHMATSVRADNFKRWDGFNEIDRHKKYIYNYKSSIYLVASPRPSCLPPLF